MIRVYVDSLSDYVWIRHLIETGVINTKSDSEFIKEFKKYGLETEREVTYYSSKNYIKDLEIEGEGEENKENDIEKHKNIYNKMQKLRNNMIYDSNISKIINKNE